ncbi:MAG: T9SS type A sorting domain-containing protein [Flavobacteriales bacterium]|nr:T9SS type A sorting domain-containing protein [Flavobacteriales bacterium]
MQKIYFSLIIGLSALYSYSQTGPSSGSAVVQNGAGTSWTNTGNLFSSDDNRAECTPGNGNNSRNLNIDNFGFAITDGDDIDGIEVHVEWSASFANRIYQDRVRLLIAGVTSGDNKSTGAAISTTETTTTFGGPTDTWGLALTEADIEHADFGVRLRVNQSGGGTRTGYIDNVSITVYHSSGGPTTFTTTTSGDWNLGTTWNQTACASGCVAGVDFPGTGDITNINGGHTVDIPTGVSATCDDLTLNADGSTNSASILNLTSSSTLTVEGDLHLAGAAPTATVTNEINMNSAIVSVNGNLTLDAYKSGSDRFHQTIDVGATGVLSISGDVTTTDNGGAQGTAQIDASAGGTVVFGGSITLAESDEDLQIGSGANITYNAAGAQSIIRDNSWDYENLTLSGSGVKTLSGNINVNGTLSLQGTATFSDGGNNLTYGNTSSLEYAGSSTQTPGDEMNATNNVQTLIINNSNGVQLGSDETIDDNLTLTSGKLDLGANNLTVATAGGITGGSTSSYVYTSGAGELRMTTSGSTTYPVGLNAFYNPIVLDPSSEVEYQVRVLGSFSNAPTDGNRVANVEFDINTSASPGNTNITLEWDQSQEAVNFQSNDATVYIGHYNGSSWDEYPGVYNENSPSAGRSTVTILNYNDGYSPFGVGAGSGALPVELTSFSAEEENDAKVHLHWTTNSEINNSHFVIERSQTNDGFEPIGQLQGSGNSNVPKDYYFVDEDPFLGESFYRLKQVDFDGNFEYSKVIAVTTEHDNSAFDANKHHFVVFPNPSSGEQVFVKAYGEDPDERVNIVVTDNMGKIVSTQVVITGHDGEYVTGLDAGEKLAPGIYTVNEFYHDEIQSTKLIIHE